MNGLERIFKSDKKFKRLWGQKIDILFSQMDEDVVEVLKNKDELSIFMVDKRGCLSGMFDQERYDKLNEFQLLLYKYSIRYRCLFIKPIRVNIK